MGHHGLQDLVTILSTLLLRTEAQQAHELPEFTQAALLCFGEVKHGPRAPISLSPSYTLPGSSHQPQEMLQVLLGAKRTRWGLCRRPRSCSLMAGNERNPCLGKQKEVHSISIPRQEKHLTRSS